ncbi:NAD-dependent epimerase/dehydratase [Coprinopsis cinerea okayama7|uniref:NAD-dependent epimerase/dehydratase n=1 Tax=Coprinopsis cinerea (strain Okayama-7 / 130 / ATCC MYA-4618 / FGSC 9003) TaxID=240176 RepID=D6RQ95_COPC7|nr:NAD-dependent epimerase/dehydratase [Coprinopsis cinerea okayama7\|eukprot:XP_002910307.1 NAD-dependent epimerase/dehydratase [Coprinopsis cinerea okayama7\
MVSLLGSHFAKRLISSGEYRVRIIDQSPKPTFPEGDLCHELIIGNLCDPSTCRSAVDGVSIVCHFAANMGGMGTIHEANEFRIYAENHFMTLHLLQAAIEAGVKRFLYASTACVYPLHLQQSVEPATPLSLSEDDVYRDATSESPPCPQGLYGLEKLSTELLLHQASSKVSVRIARLHNVYGPGGTWNSGREKAPAAMLRKALALKRLGAGSSHSFEIWGDGQQQRSFLYIDDAVDTLLKLLASDYSSPLNIGSDTSVSILRLSKLALRVARADSGRVSFSFDTTKPVGVASRNSNNERVSRVLGWRPSTSLDVGMAKTCAWMEKEMERLLSQRESGLARETLLLQCLSSKVVDLKEEATVFAILLPITSRGGTSPQSCLSNLGKFAQSLSDTTWRDLHSLGGKRYRVAIYLAIDHDDEFLLADQGPNKAEALLRSHGFSDVTSLICDYPRGHVCSLWRDCAARAFDDCCDYYGLFGDDVSILDEGWMRKMDESSTESPSTKVSLLLYRRWNASRMVDLRLSNSIGGSDDARYAKQRARDWTFDTLTNAVSSVDSHIRSFNPSISPTLTLDVVIPCYRVDLAIISNILALQHSPTLTIMFIIIVDNPSSPQILKLETLYGRRPDVRIRVNSVNLGASASRNRGMSESSAEWVYFLDDDIVPDADLLFEAEKVIREHPDAAGFVGNTVFPKSETIFQAAVHLAGVTYFWDIATKIEDDVPWGVTANLIARRNIKDGIEYDLRYPKTGGGEDIDFCRLKREVSIKRGGSGFGAAPLVRVTHPYWNNGKRSYWRFYMWAYGDGMLVARFPELTYRDYAPNSAEYLLLAIALPFIVLPLGDNLLSSLYLTAYLIAKGLSSVVLANVLHDIYRHLWQHPERDAGLNSSIKSGPRFWLALVESSFIRMSSELGRLKGAVDRKQWYCIGKRFDWFAGREGDGPKREERWNNVQRLVCIVLIFRFVL